jgi:hypothetical protein
MPPAEHVERQITVAIVIAVKEPPFLLPVERILGRIQIQNDRLRRPSMRLQKDIDQKILDGHRIVTDLVIARRLQPAQFQPVQRRLTRNRRAIPAARLELARQHRHHRIVAQFVVVIEILIAKRDAEYPLAHQGPDRVLNRSRTPRVVKGRCKPPDQSDRPVCRAQQQRPGASNSGGVSADGAGPPEQIQPCWDATSRSWRRPDATTHNVRRAT